MKKIIPLLLLIFIASLVSAQDDTQLSIKLDSIIQEADLLYRYEKVAWNSSDLFQSNKKLGKDYGGYIIYHSNDTLHASYVDKQQSTRVAKYSFISTELNKPFTSIVKRAVLSDNEQALLSIKSKIINQLSDQKYGVGFPAGFTPNLVLVKSNDGYKLYILMGTSTSDVIPFGNDYLFYSDLEGDIIKWEKFHSRIIPTQTKGPNAEVVLSAVHSHLKTTPLITATDICTFRLYGGLYGMKEFMVLSTATGKYYTYNIDTNRIEITEP
jgi:hypothetical protein